MPGQRASRAPLRTNVAHQDGVGSRLVVMPDFFDFRQTDMRRYAGKGGGDVKSRAKVSESQTHRPQVPKSVSVRLF